jgi:hypothetical protein
MLRTNRRFLSILLVAGLILISPSLGSAQDTSGLDWNQPVDTMASALGVHYGQFGGQGLAFNVPLKWYLYFQGAGGVWHVNDDKRHNLGASLHYILRQDQRAGLGYYYHKELMDGLWDIEENWNTGGGIGIEYLQGKRWSWQLDLAFVHESEDGDIKLFPQAGLFYYW